MLSAAAAPRARSAPARARPRFTTAPPTPIMEHHDYVPSSSFMPAAAGGETGWKHSLRSPDRSPESDGGFQRDEDPRWLRKGGGRRAADGPASAADPEEEEMAAVLPGKAKAQPGLSARWAHVPSRIKGQKPWQQLRASSPDVRFHPLLHRTWAHTYLQSKATGSDSVRIHILRSRSRRPRRATTRRSRSCSRSAEGRARRSQAAPHDPIPGARRPL